MPFIREKDYDNAIQKVRINVGKELNLEHEDDAFVIIKEPSEKEVLEFRTVKDESERIAVFEKLFRNRIVDHDFYEDVNKTKKMANDDVIDLLFEKIDTTNKVISEYSDAVFGSRMKSDKKK